MTNLRAEALTHIRGTIRFAGRAPRTGSAATSMECYHGFRDGQGRLAQLRLGKLLLDMSRQDAARGDFELDVVLLPKPGDAELMRPGVQWRLEEIPGVPFAIGTITEVVATGPGIGRV